MPLGIALMAVLWCGEPNAHDEPPEVAVLPIGDGGGLTAADRMRLEERMRRTLAAADLKVDAEAAVSAAKCETDMCQRRTLQSHGVSYWLGAAVRGGNRMYDVELTLWSDASSDPVARTRERCSICGQAELAELVAAQTLDLRRWITEANTTPAAGGQPSEQNISVTRGGTRDGDVELRHDSKRPNLRPWGIASLTTGLAVTTSGAVLLGLHGREYGPRCEQGSPNLDDDGDCRYVHKTLAGGVVATIAGIGLTATGLTLMTLERRTGDGKRRAQLRLELLPKRLVFAGRF